jgi:hypothetical protein
VALKVMVMEQDARDATLAQQALICEKEVALASAKVIPVMVSIVGSKVVSASFCIIEPVAKEKERAYWCHMVGFLNPFLGAARRY